jgi:hypothetical protein
VDYFTGDGTSTTFQLSRIPASPTSILVHIGGVKQVASTTDPAYYLDGSKLVFVSPPGAYSPIEVNYLGIAGQVNIPGTQSVTQDMLSLQLANTFVYQTTANGATASFTLNAPPVSANSLVVSANGVVQYDYSVNGTNLTFGFTPPAGTLVRVTSLALAQAGVPADGSVTSVKLGANLALTGNTTATLGGGTINNMAIGGTTPAIGRFTDLTDTGLTSGRVIYAGAGGNLVDSINLIFNGTTLSAAGFSGPFNGTVGGTTPSTGAFTTLSASGAFSANGGVTLGDASGDALTINSSAVSIPNGLNFDSNTLVIDAANNRVGIGTTSPTVPLDIAGAARITGSNLSIVPSTTTSAAYLLNTNASGNFFFAIDNSTGASFGAGNYGRVIYSSAAYPLAFFTNDTERMRIDSSGNVGIGTSSPGARLELGGTNPTIYFGPAGTASGGYIGYNTDNNYLSINAVSQGVSYRNIAIASDGGNCIVGATTTSGSGKFVVSTNTGYCATMNSVSNNADYIQFWNGSQVGSINRVGGSNVNYNTSSDYRLKHDVAPMTGALQRVALLKPCTYKWNIDDSEGEGFIAHELAEVVPQAVTGEKDALEEDGSIKPQGIDTSNLVALLTAAIQEQQAQIEELKAEIQYLKAK